MSRTVMWESAFAVVGRAFKNMHPSRIFSCTEWEYDLLSSHDKKSGIDAVRLVRRKEGR